MVQSILKQILGKHTVESGYLLPAAIMLGLGISTVSVLALQTVARNSSTLSYQQYSSVAREAARAGVAAAISCINSNGGVRVWGIGGTSDQENLTPKGCSLTPTGTNDYISDNDRYRSTFRVLPVTDLNNIGTNKTTSIITAKGIVYIKGPGGTTVETIEHVAKAQVATTVNAAGSPGKKHVVQISTGTDTACATTSDSDLNDYWAYCWGSNSNMQLGNGRLLANDRSLEPVPVYNSAVTQAEIPGVCTGSIFGACLGWNPAKTPAQNPTPMAGKRVVKVSVGNTHTCAIAQTGADDTTRRAYCWGRNSDGQLGNHTTTDSLIPIEVDTDAARPAVTHVPSPCGGWFQPSCTPVVDVPAKPESSLRNKTIVDISAGNRFTCALASDGLVSCWGRNSDGQLGNNSTTSSMVPTAVSQSTRLVKKLAVVKGNATTMCAITTADDGICWGKSDVGQTGNGAYIDPTNRSGSDSYRHSNPNQCNNIRPTVLNNAKSRAGGSPHDDTDALQPVLVTGGHKFDTITVNNGETSGDSYESISPGTSTTRISTSGSSSAYVTAKTLSGRVYQWGGTRSFDAFIDCIRNSDTVGGDWSRADARVERSYTGTSSPRLMYDAASGNLERATLNVISGNAFNGLFCATANGSLYCDSRGGEPRDGQVGDGRVISCTTILVWTTCTPTPASNAVKVSTTQQADTSAIHGSDLTVGMAQAISGLDTSNSGFSCAIANLAVLCWGVNGSGQLGTGNTNKRYAPTYVLTNNSNALGKTISGGSGVPVSGPAAINSSNGPITNSAAARYF